MMGVCLCRRGFQRAIDTGHRYRFKQTMQPLSNPNPDTDRSNNRPVYNEIAGNHATALGNRYIGHPLRLDSMRSLSAMWKFATGCDPHDTSPGTQQCCANLGRVGAAPELP
jgi:hypothetical protein